MKRLMLAGMFFLIFTSFMPLNAQWVKSYGGSSWDEPTSICQTIDGGYIVAGRTQSFGTGTTDIWILKLFLNGDIEWQKTYGGDEYDNQDANSIQQTNDGGYIVAGSRSTSSPILKGRDIWILKLSSNGDIEWQRTYGGSDSDGASSIQQTTDGGYIVAGSTGPFDAEEADIWILKLTSGGDIEWQRTYGGSDSDRASSIQQTTDGGYIVAGSTSSFGAGDCDIWVLKLFSNGDIEWQRTYGGSDSDHASSIQQTTDGGYIVAGGTNVLKLSSEGNIDWQKTYKGEYGYQDLNSIQQTNDGGYIVAGSHSSSGIIKGRDFWILKLSTAGDIEWQKKYGCVRPDYADSIKQTSDGEYVVAGHTEFFGYPDFLVLKLSSNGELFPYCDLVRSTNVIVTDTDASPDNTDITHQDTNIEHQETNVYPTETNAIVYDFCSGKYILRITASSGGTTDPSPGIHTYDPGTRVTIKAIPSDNHYFGGWGEDASDFTLNSNPITITMNSHKLISAGFGEKWQGEPVKLGGPDCFIATAAHGSPLHPHVKILRDFRNKYLMPNKFGRKFVDLYYKYSPSVANIITRNKPLKVIVRTYMLPVVIFSYSMVHLGPIVTGGILLLILVLPIFYMSDQRRR